MSDLFGQAGNQPLDRLALPTAFQARVNSLRRLLDPLDAEIELFSGMVRARLAGHPGYQAIQAIDGLGPVLASVLVAEIGDVARFPGPPSPTQLGRVDAPPSRVRHPRASRPDHQAGFPAAPAGRRWKRCNGSAPTPGWGRSATGSPRAAAPSIGVVAAARELIGLVYYGLRDGHIRRLAA